MTTSNLDRQHITDVLLTYCVSIDSFDFAALAGLLTPDVVVTYHGHEPMVGADEVVGFVARYCGDFVWQQHVPTLMAVHIDGDTARTTSYVTVHSVRRDDPDRVTLTVGEYHDTLVRTDDGWRIADRSLHTGWRETRSRV